MKRISHKKSVRVFALIALLASAAFVFTAPHYFSGKIGTDRSTDEFLIKAEPTVGVIEVWHIAEFKPFIGSLGVWLTKRASEFRSNYVNLYLNVRSLSPDEARLELGRGLVPDIISFAEDTEFESYSENCVPYCATGHLLLFDPNRFDPQDTETAPGIINEFKKGKAASCVCDIGEAGVLYRAQLLGECPYFEAEVYREKGFRIQCIGCFSGIDKAKLPYAKAFVEFISGGKCQNMISEIGLIPISSDAKADYEVDWLYELFQEFHLEQQTDS